MEYQENMKSTTNSSYQNVRFFNQLCPENFNEIFFFISDVDPELRISNNILETEFSNTNY